MGDIQQIIGIKRFFDIFIGTAFDRGHSRFDIAVAGNNHHGNVGVQLLDAVQNLQAVEATALQPDIQNHQRRSSVFDGDERFIAVCRKPRFVSFVFKNSGYEFPDIRLVVHN